MYVLLRTGFTKMSFSEHVNVSDYLHGFACRKSTVCTRFCAWKGKSRAKRTLIPVKYASDVIQGCCNIMGTKLPFVLKCRG